MVYNMSIPTLCYMNALFQKVYNLHTIYYVSVVEENFIPSNST